MWINFCSFSFLIIGFSSYQTRSKFIIIWIFWNKGRDAVVDDNLIFCIKFFSKMTIICFTTCCSSDLSMYFSFFLFIVSEISYFEMCFSGSLSKPFSTWPSWLVRLFSIISYIDSLIYRMDLWITFLRRRSFVSAKSSSVIIVQIKK